MDALTRTAAALRKLGAEMKPDIPQIDVALPAVRALLRDAKVPFKIVGGLAVMLLKRIDDTRYIYVEAAVRAEHRPELAGLRDEALQELEWDRMNGGT